MSDVCEKPSVEPVDSVSPPESAMAKAPAIVEGSSVQLPKPINSARRILASVIAHLYAQSVTIVTQLASLPIFLLILSTGDYGRWLMISAIPVYISMSDLGVLTAAGNQMTMAWARGEKLEFEEVFHSATLVALGFFPAAAILGCGAIAMFQSGFIADNDLKLPACLLVVAASISAACGLLDAAYRALGKYSRVTYIITTGRLMDWVGSIAGLLVGKSLLSAAVGVIAMRLLVSAVMWHLAKRDLPELQWGIRRAESARVKQLLWLGSGLLAFPVSTLLSLQGTLLLVGSILGPTAAVAFNAFRVLARVIAQASTLVTRSAAPEVSRLFGSGRIAEMIAVCKKAHRITILTALAGTATLGFVGKDLIRIWSHGQIIFEPNTYMVLLASTLATAFWQIPSVELTATNRHDRLAVFAMLVAVATIVATWMLTARYGLMVPAVASLVGEIIMIVATTAILRRILRSL